MAFDPDFRPVRAFHLILTCYGFWLPNDPRGSGSTMVWSELLRDFGPATYVDSKASVAKRAHDASLRRAAKRALKHPPVRFSGVQALAVARGFKRELAKQNVDCFACAIMQDHVHLVVARPAGSIEALAVDLKAASVHELFEEEIHPFQAIRDRTGEIVKVWARGQRKMFVFDEPEIRRSIGYVERNPTFSGLPRQHWSFVKPFDAQAFFG